MFKSSTSLKRLKALLGCESGHISAGHPVCYCTVGCLRLWQFRSVMQPRGPLSHASSNASPIHESSPSYLSTSSSTTQYQAVDICTHVCMYYIHRQYFLEAKDPPASSRYLALDEYQWQIFSFLFSMVFFGAYSLT